MLTRPPGGKKVLLWQQMLRHELLAALTQDPDDWRLKFGPEVGRYAKFPERRREMAHGVMGDPFVASAAKGERLFSILVERLTALCREYHDIDPSKYREFGSHCP